MEGKRRACSTPTSVARLGGRDPRRRASRSMAAERRGHRRAPRAPTSPPTSPIFTPPFLGSRVAKGIAARRHRRATSTRPRCSATSGSSGPTSRSARTTPSSRSASARRCARELDEAKAEGWLVPAVVWGYFPVNADGNDLIVWTDDDRRTERLRFTFPRQRKDRHLCIADFFRSGRERRRRLRRVPRGHRRRRRLASASASCSPPTSTRSTSSATASRSR